MSNELQITWIDEDGVESRSSMSVDETDPAVLDVQNLISALGAVSEAAIKSYGIIQTDDLAPAVPVAGPYDMADKLTLEATTSTGNVAKVSFPAPLAALLVDSDDVATAELGGVPFTAFFDAVKAIWESDGQTLVTLIRAYRTRTARSNN